jgi:hypothetical protein
LYSVDICKVTWQRGKALLEREATGLVAVLNKNSGLAPALGVAKCTIA